MSRYMLDRLNRDRSSWFTADNEDEAIDHAKTAAESGSMVTLWREIGTASPGSRAPSEFQSREKFDAREVAE